MQVPVHNDREASRWQSCGQEAGRRCSTFKLPGRIQTCKERYNNDTKNVSVNEMHRQSDCEMKPPNPPPRFSEDHKQWGFEYRDQK